VSAICVTLECPAGFLHPNLFLVAWQLEKTARALSANCCCMTHHPLITNRLAGSLWRQMPALLSQRFSTCQNLKGKQCHKRDASPFPLLATTTILTVGDGIALTQSVPPCCIASPFRARFCVFSLVEADWTLVTLSAFLLLLTECLGALCLASPTDKAWNPVGVNAP